MTRLKGASWQDTKVRGLWNPQAMERAELWPFCASYKEPRRSICCCLVWVGKADHVLPLAQVKRLPGWGFQILEASLPGVTLWPEETRAPHTGSAERRSLLLPLWRRKRTNPQLPSLFS